MGLKRFLAASSCVVSFHLIETLVQGVDARPFGAALSKRIHFITDIGEDLSIKTPPGCHFTHSLPPGMEATILDWSKHGVLDCDCRALGTCPKGEPPAPPINEFLPLAKQRLSGADDKLPTPKNSKQGKVKTTDLHWPDWHNPYHDEPSQMDTKTHKPNHQNKPVEQTPSDGPHLGWDIPPVDKRSIVLENGNAVNPLNVSEHGGQIGNARGPSIKELVLEFLIVVVATMLGIYLVGFVLPNQLQRLKAFYRSIRHRGRSASLPDLEAGDRGADKFSTVPGIRITITPPPDGHRCCQLKPKCNRKHLDDPELANDILREAIEQVKKFDPERYDLLKETRIPRYGATDPISVPPRRTTDKVMEM